MKPSSATPLVSQQPGLGSPYWLAYQPIFHITPKRRNVIAFESLLRVQIDGTSHSPAEVVAAAELDGSIVSIDRWVLHDVIRLAITRPSLHVWVNASQISIGHPSFLEDAIQSLTESRTITRVAFEITETADIDASLLAKRLASLKVKTLTLMVDDIRDGYAKRSLLQNDAVAGCKLSRETTVELQTSERVRAEVQRLVNHCRVIGKKVVLEGIENETDLALATSLGIEFCQGYHFGYPSAPAKLQIYPEMQQPK
ncbi:EAL domain-containing protein [Pseudomonas sp. NPDC089569]|uniref:EAL domain-containing protein n=1 Tax=Pseudomonas sp. NPDC089569 TaxID=3390722 RepID=UPI003D02C8BD